MYLRFILFLTCCAFSSVAFTSKLFINNHEIEQIVIFGDSLSDTGNVFALTKAAHKVTPKVPIIPDAPYVDGHFSNGRIWNEYLFDDVVNLNLDKKKEYLNYAYGGAWAEGADQSKSSIPPGLGLQVKSYLFQNFFSNKSKTLYILMVGNNDFLDTRDDLEQATTETVSAIHQALDKLKNAGGKHFLVASLPDIAKTPRALNESREDYFHTAVLKHNDKLKAMIKQYDIEQSDNDMELINVYQFFNSVLDKASEYGFSDTQTACIDSQLLSVIPEVNSDESTLPELAEINANPVLRQARKNSLAYQHAKNSFGESGVCENQDEHFFWDDIHPTTKGQKAIAHQICISLVQDFSAKDSSGQTLDCSKIM